MTLDTRNSLCETRLPDARRAEQERGICGIAIREWSKDICEVRDFGVTMLDFRRNESSSQDTSIGYHT